MKVQKFIEVRLLKKRIIPFIDLVQYDTGVQFVFSLVDFDIPSGTSATLYVQKRSGKFVYQEKNITVSGNQITIDLENQALTEHGETKYQIKLKNGTDTVTTFAGVLRIEKSLADANAVESKTVIRAFDELTAEKIAEIGAATADFITQAEEQIEAKTSASLASIPDDYTELSNTADEAIRTKADAIVCETEGKIVAVADSSDNFLRGLRIFGKSTQDGTPTPDAPVEIKNVVNPTISVNEQTLTISKTLPGIPVTSGGNYTDSDGQQWICDEVDLERGVYVRRLFAETITDFAKATSYTYDGVGTSCAVAIVESVTAHTALCSHFVIAHKSTIIDRFNLIGKNLYFKLAGELSWEEWVERMSELAPTVVGVLDKTIETPLSETEIAAYRALHSNYPNTTVLNDAGAWMDVKYNADTKLYIDRRIAELMQ
jgi:hypothetical protein